MGGDITTRRNNLLNDQVVAPTVKSKKWGRLADKTKKLLASKENRGGSHLHLVRWVVLLKKLHQGQVGKVVGKVQRAGHIKLKKGVHNP